MFPSCSVHAVLLLTALLVQQASASSTCGKKSSQTGRIVGGRETKPGDYPWQVGIKLKSGFMTYHACGGALINEQWIATAAHCFKSKRSIKKYIFRLGDFDTNVTDQGELNLQADRIVVHKRFNSTTYVNDIALVHLEKPLELDGAHRYLTSICLPDASQDFSDAWCTATGWGKTDFKGSSSHILMEVRLPIWQHDKCHKAYKQFNNIQKSMFCAGYDEGGKSSCSGDSGGPLQCTLDQKTWFLTGIVSHSVDCALPGTPTVFTKVASFRKFIRNMLSKYS